MSEALERLGAALHDRYTVEREIGAGGMATVYLAQDLKHDRRVAVKVLRPELAALLGGERFLNEIRVTANLQHPNILPLYDSGEADGILYYVMPFVEGESLRDRLTREKQLPVEESIEITRAVASALDFAHRRDVIHRDIKPENILLLDGQPVVADFGIALAVSQAGGTRLTETGLSLGTPYYMSPEQSMGDREVDARSDVYSLAAMLYEMLAGDPPFTGSTAQAILAKLITEKPTLLTRHRDTVPRHVAATVNKALSKLPADRYPTAASFAEALVRPVLADTEEHASLGVPWSFPPAAILAGFVVLGGLALWGWLRPSTEAARPVRRLLVAAPMVAGVQHPFQYPPALSPDGTTLVYTLVRTRGPRESQGLYVRRLDEFDVRLIPNTEGAESPFFSPDGRWIGFSVGSTLRKVPVGGGSVFTIAETGGGVQSASWGPGDVIVFAGVLGGLSKVSADGGIPEVVTTIGQDPNDVGHYAPNVLPNGDAVLLTSWAGGTASHRIAVASMKPGEWKVLVEGGAAPRYVPSGHIVFIRSDGSLWAVPFDADQLEVTGEPSPVMDEPVRMGRLSGVAYYAVANDGTLAFIPRLDTQQGNLVWVERDGSATPLGFPPAQFLHPRISPEGRRVALTVQDQDVGDEEIRVLDLDRGTQTRLTLTGTVNRWPVWTHAGTRIAFMSTRTDTPFDLYWKAADGSGDAQLLRTSDRAKVPTSWTQDRGALVYYEMVGSTGGDVMAIEGEETPIALETSRFDERSPMFSSDGRWIAYVSDESGRDEVYVRPYPGPGSRTLISTEGGIEPSWSRDGGALFYRREMDMIEVSIDGTTDLMAGTPRVLFTEPYMLGPIGRGNPNYDVAADGRFLMVRQAGGGEVAPLHVVLNWFEELKSRMRPE